jgi:DNA polymerase-3 subunit delta'
LAPFEGVAGHEQPLRLLRSQLASGRLSHAYLFVGEPGLGKTTVGQELAAALLPEAPLRRHPDYWEDDRIKSLKIDEIRLLPDRDPEFHQQSLQAFLSLKPAVGRHRVAVISNVGRLPDPVQGVLLKTLEEPHPNRVIILTTPSLSPFVVLPTVASRCQRVAFQPVAARAIEDLLSAHGVEAERAAILAQVSRGRPGWALSAARDPDVVARHRECSRRLDELFGAPADVALTLAAELDQAQMAWRSSEREAEDPVLFALGSWQLRLRERMLAEGRPGRWAKLLELSFDTIGYLEQNVSPRLALECFLLECRRAS